METLRCRAYSHEAVKNQTLAVQDMEESLRNQQQQVTAVKMENTRYGSKAQAHANTYSSSTTATTSTHSEFLG